MTSAHCDALQSDNTENDYFQRFFFFWLGTDSDDVVISFLLSRELALGYSETHAEGTEITSLEGCNRLKCYATGNRYHHSPIAANSNSKQFIFPISLPHSTHTTNSLIQSFFFFLICCCCFFFYLEMK